MRFRDWSSLRYYLLWAYEDAVPLHAHVGTYSDDDIACWLIIKGSVKLTTNGNSVTARRGQWVFVASPLRHQAFSRDAEILSLHIHLSWPGGDPLFERTRNVIFDAAQFPQLEAAARPMLQLVQRHFPQAETYLPCTPCGLGVYLRVQNLLPTWIASYYDTLIALGFVPRRLAGIDERVLNSVVELDRLPLQQRMNEKSLARNAGLSKTHFNALFVEELGTTPRRYFERRRLDSADQLLTRTGMSIKEIAFTLGFKYESHFCAWFRRLRGMRPTAFREGAQTPRLHRGNAKGSNR